MNFPIPVFFVSFVALTIFLAFKRNRQSQNQDNINLSFLERERRADNTRKKDISNLDYLQFSVKQLPIAQIHDEELSSIETALTELSKQRIINLSAYSNTELKLMYGPANLTALSEYDDNYHRLATTLLSYADRLEELGHTNTAVAVLEYAMELHIQLGQIYLQLARLYIKQQTPENIHTIEETLLTMEESFASHILPKLKNVAEHS